MKQPTNKFSAQDFSRAWQEWGCNCGPGAVAALAGLTLDEVRPHLGDFEQKRYTDPLLMFSILDMLRIPVMGCTRYWPTFGLVRIQWEGPWTEPEAPANARLRHSHWVAVSYDWTFDINALSNGSGWITRMKWEDQLAPWLISQVEPDGYGTWHVTHGISVPAYFPRGKEVVWK